MMSKRTSAALSFLVLWSFVALAQAPSAESVSAAARVAYKSGDHPSYLELMQQLDQLRPNHPVILFNLAGAHALNGDAVTAAQILQRLAAMDLTFDVAAERDFDGVRSTLEMQAAAAEMSAVNEKRVATAEVAFRLDDRDLVTESIVHDPASGSFFVSSIRKRKIVRIDRSGAIRDFAVDLEYAPLGMAIDPAKRLLWVATSAFPRMEGFRPDLEGRAALLAVSLATGKIVRRIDADGFLDSVAVMPSQTVIVSESRGTLYKVDGDGLVALVQPGRMRSPQGIAPAGDGETVYVADYGRGIHRVDVRTGDLLTLAAPPGVPMIGIDGLTRDGDSLIAVMNGVPLHRVVRFRLRADGNAIEEATIVEMNTPHLDEPTNGTIANGDFYFVAASQGHRYDGAAPPDPATLAQPVILRIARRTPRPR